MTAKEKERNRKMSQIRVKVEHAISGIMRSRIVKGILRNTKDNFSDLVMVVASRSSQEIFETIANNRIMFNE